MDRPAGMLQKRRRSVSVSSASSSASTSSSASSSSGSTTSLSTPAHKHARPPSPSQSTSPQWTCSLEPTCSAKPQAFPTAAELERHYARVHELACEAVVAVGSGAGGGSASGAKGKGRQTERRCGCVFPERRLLELHHNEFHNPLLAELASRGERIYECLLPPALCDHKSRTPKGRRLHMVDKHFYPKEYFFGVVKVGIGQLLVNQGLGASLLRPPHTPSTPSTSHRPSGLTQTSPPSLSAISSLSKPRRPPSPDAMVTEQEREEDDLAGLADRMAASLAFMPRSVQRKGKGKVVVK